MARAERTTDDAPDRQLDVEIDWGEVSTSGVQFVTPEEGRAYFDEQARELLGISGAEFVRRHDAGEYDDIIDDPAHDAVGFLAFLIDLAR
jgi:hypothetical protein